MFGKRGIGASGPSAPRDGRAWVDQNLARYDQPGSLEFAHSLGLALFDSSYQAMKDERGVQIEAIVAMLASVGGHVCLAAILEALRDQQLQPADVGMVVIEGSDGHRYFFGDAPNRLLCEAEHSFVSLVFGAAHQRGAPVSLEMVDEEMGIVASRVGTARFGELDLPGGISVDSPLNWARHFTRYVVGKVGEHFRDALAHKPIKVPADALAPSFLLPRILGFAVQRAIDVGHQALDPMILARIAMGCSLRTAKMDPQWVLGCESRAA